MPRPTLGKLYSVTGLVLAITVVHFADLPLGPSRPGLSSDRTIKLIGSESAGFKLAAPLPSAWAASECRGCDFCRGGRPNQHLLFDAGRRTHTPGAEDHVGECWSSGPCDQWHPDNPEQCGESFAQAGPDLTNLWHGLVNGMPSYQLARVIRKRPEVIELNSARQAIQVVGCEGQIVAHLPISSDDVRALQMLLE